MRASLSAFSAAYLMLAGAFGTAAYVASHPAIAATLSDLPGILNEAAAQSRARLENWADQATTQYADAVTERTGRAPRNVLAAYYSTNIFAGLAGPPPAKPSLRSSLDPANGAPPEMTAEIIIASASATSRPKNDVEISDAWYAPIRDSENLLRAEQRLLRQLSADHLTRFDLFIYVSKAASGPLAQQMYVFTRDETASGDAPLALLHHWPVSTGREATERVPSGRMVSTATPAGYFQFDARRMFEDYHSNQWNGPMPHAMFFNWVDRGRLTGVAIHGTVARQVPYLGGRASAGCVRLSPDAATTLFNLVRSEYRGVVPRFAYDTATDSLARDCSLERDEDGLVENADGYRVLVVIDADGGQPPAMF
jgi:lipoprotein-anchoring transpeptidase ErfK/SrfK